MTDREKLESAAKSMLTQALRRASECFFENRRLNVTDQCGYKVSVMEAIFRPLWGLGPLFDGDLKVKTASGETDASKLVRDMILTGTDEADDRCFSAFAASDPDSFANQSVTELAGYAVALHFARRFLWDPYTEEEKKQVGGWMTKWATLALRRSWENNHFWFPLLVITALDKLGLDIGDVSDDVRRAFRTLDAMYIGGGWYQDGVFGRFDYYLAWSHHVYPLLWSKMAKGTRFYDPKRAAEYKKRAEEFIPFYLCFFDESGAVPPMGRSLSYRFAQSAIFAVAAYAGCDMDYGACRTALMRNVEYFDESPYFDERSYPGYLYPSAPLSDSYTSRYGSLWCAKTFLALAIKEDHPFWADAENPLPSEKGDFLIHAAPGRVHISISSDSKSGVTLYNNTSTYYGGDFGHTFNDMASCYCKFVYNSRSGFAFSIPDKVASDSMISLLTPDFTMGSHRREYRDLGRDGETLISEHVPFSNDPETVIKTWLIPIRGALHVRAHRVDLSRPYRVREGGYPIALSSDSYSYSDGVLSYRKAVSEMKTVASVPFRLRLETHAPGRHLLAPQSKYPVYETDVLERGTYYFASVFTYREKIYEALPELSLEGAALKIVFDDNTTEIELV